MNKLHPILLVVILVLHATEPFVNAQQSSEEQRLKRSSAFPKRTRIRTVN